MSRAGIQTHDISNMSRLPLPLDQTPAHRKIFKGFLPFGQNLEPILATYLFFWAKFRCCKY